MRLFIAGLITMAITISTVAQEKKTILIFGDSITAGYGIDPGDAFPAILQQKIDSLGLHYLVINGGLSGETSAGGLRRINWVLQRKIDIILIELGGNDGLRGIDLISTKGNLQGIIDVARTKYPNMKLILAGMQVPPNLGIEYTRDFQLLYTELAEKNNITLIPTILNEVGGQDDLMQPDGIHPNVAGHKVVAETVWKFLKPIILQ